MSDTIHLTLPIPVSVNSAYAGKSHRHKSKKYIDWEKEALVKISEQPTYTIEGDEWLMAKYDYHMPLHYKNGKKKIQDVANYEKALSDFLAHKIIGFKDHKIKEIILKKVESNRNEVDISITEIK